MKVLIAEKPSVAKELAKIVNAKEQKQGYFAGGEYFVTWCYGHLVEEAQPEDYGKQYKEWSLDTLPILPQSWKTKVISKTSSQFDVIKTLMEDKGVDEIISAGDCGREGELIFRLVYEKAECKKPVKRLWVSSLEEKELRRGLNELRDDSEFDGLYQSAACRSHADWLIGMNFSRLYSVMYNHTLRIGRVKTPTVSMIVRRQEEIDQFVPKPFWTINADLGGWKAATTAFEEKANAQKVFDRCNHKTAQVIKVTQEEKRTKPPKLYSITELQREANRLLGYTSQQTLDYLQALYEAKLTTYPRTECEYLPSDMLSGLPDRLEKVLALPCIAGIGEHINAEKIDFSQVINDEKQTDHHAVIPTGQAENNLPEPEKNILRLVACRFLAAVSSVQIYQQTTILLDIEGEPFKATGKAVTQKGYVEVIDSMKRMLKGLDEDLPENQGEETIPVGIQEGQQFANVDLLIKEGSSVPPRPFTEDSLLAAMKNVSSVMGDQKLKAAIKELGLGTGATRAGIIESVVKDGYVIRDKKNLRPSEDAKKLVEIVDRKMTHPEMTAEWEASLEEIASGKLEASKFLSEIESYVRAIVDTAKEYGERDTTLFKPARENVGICPRCGMNVMDFPKSFSCESGKDGCGFSIWKENIFWTSKKKKLTPEIMTKLLKKGSVKVKGFYSEKKDSNYDATVSLDDTGKYINFKMVFEQKKK